MEELDAALKRARQRRQFPSRFGVDDLLENNESNDIKDPVRDERTRAQPQADKVKAGDRQVTLDLLATGTGLVGSGLVGSGPVGSGLTWHVLEETRVLEREHASAPVASVEGFPFVSESHAFLPPINCSANCTGPQLDNSSLSRFEAEENGALPSGFGLPLSPLDLLSDLGDFSNSAEELRQAAELGDNQPTCAVFETGTVDADVEQREPASCPVEALLDFPGLPYLFPGEAESHDASLPSSSSHPSAKVDPQKDKIHLGAVCQQTLKDRASRADASGSGGSPGVLSSAGDGELSWRLAATLGATEQSRRICEGSLKRPSKADLSERLAAAVQVLGASRQNQSEGHDGSSSTSQALAHVALAPHVVAPWYTPGVPQGSSRKSAPWPGASSVHVQRALVPEASLLGGAEVAMKERLVLAAKALEQRDMRLFQDVCDHLRPFARPHGKALQRLVHALLRALLMRNERTAFLSLSAIRVNKIQETNRARQWYFQNVPYVPFSSICMLGSIIPRLAGKRSIHIVDVGEMMTYEWPRILTTLATQNSQTQSRGQPAAAGQSPLRRLRITHLNVMHMARPGRWDLKDMFWPPGVQEQTESAAEALGVELVLERLDLHEGALGVLDRICRDERAEETVAFTCSYHLKFVPDDVPTTGGTVLDRIMKMVHRIRPEVIAFVEEDSPASSKSLVSRMEAYFDLNMAMTSTHDVISAGKWRKLIHFCERQFHNLNMCSVIGCEDEQRRVRPKSKTQWQKIFRDHGFQILPLDSKMLQDLHTMVRAYPKGFSITEQDEMCTISWRGIPVSFSCSFGAQHMANV